MATLYVRDVPDELYEELKERASADGRSVSAEAVRLLQEALSQGSDQQRRRREHLAALDRIRRRREDTILPPDHIDSVELLREDRAR